VAHSSHVRVPRNGGLDGEIIVLQLTEGLAFPGRRKPFIVFVNVVRDLRRLRRFEVAVLGYPGAPPVQVRRVGIEILVEEILD
jgi:hypothetical protein